MANINISIINSMTSTRNNSNNSNSNHNHKSSSPNNILTSLFKRAPTIRDLQNNQDDIEFFASLENNHDLAFFRRNEVQVGEPILTNNTTTTTTSTTAGGGRFHQVFSVTGFQPWPTTTATRKRDAFFQDNEQDVSKKYSLKTLQKAHHMKDKKDLFKAVRELIHDAKFLSRFSKRANRHPNILTLHGLTLDAYGHCFLAGDFSDFFLLTDRMSDTLAQRIHQWRLNTGRGGEPDEDMIPMKGNYAYQMAKALKHCHDHGVLFRGLQPSRIAFLNEEQHLLQLTDFGLARDVPSSSSSTSNNKPHHDSCFKMTLAGTRRYIAGEVLTTGRYSLKSDVYSWAMVWYEMLTERKPYTGLNAQDHQKYVCERGDRPNITQCYLPEAVDAILVRAWDPDVSRRLTMEQVCDKMQSFLMNLDIHYYEQKEGEFLFDVEVTEDEVSEIDEDEWLVMDQIIMQESSSSRRNNGGDELLSGLILDDSSSMESGDTAHSETGPELLTSWKSLESSTKRTMASVESKPRKLISEAA